MKATVYCKDGLLPGDLVSTPGSSGWAIAHGSTMFEFCLLE